MAQLTKVVGHVGTAKQEATCGNASGSIEAKFDGSKYQKAKPRPEVE